MKCPACFNNLSQMQVGNLVVDVCHDGCGGIWFDAFELQRVDEENEAAGEPLLGIRRDERLVIDLSRKRECPRCSGIKMRRHYFSAKRQVEVDECPNCGGDWLGARGKAQNPRRRTQNPQAEQRRRTNPPPPPDRPLFPPPPPEPKDALKL